ncbi:MAG: hypothetical protein HYX38_27030 [Rhodospirillales bacterium]|nr:hypothetical protein [Rhodospirillales bacterium]
MTQTARFLWIGPRLSAMERLCLKSFVDVGYDVELYRYDEVEGVPDGVRSCDAAEILPRDQIFQRKSGFGAGGYAEFADRFRYHLLHAKGGWWFDMDFAAVRVKPEPTDLLIASTWEFEYGQCAVNAAMWCSPGDPRMAELARRADEILSRETFDFGATGPFLVQSFIAERGLEANVAPWWEFCPFPWRMQNRMAYRTNTDWAKDCVRHVWQLYKEHTRPDFRAGYIRSGTRAVHWHNEIWKASGKDKDARYHPWSPYGRLMRRHGVRADRSG